MALTTLLAGCAPELTGVLIPNAPPQVRITEAPVARDSVRPDFYVSTIRWTAYDPDGRVNHFLIAVDQPDPVSYSPNDTAWHVTVRNESTLVFSAGSRYDPVNPRDPRAQTPHVVSLFAVDDQGARSSRPATRAFFSFTQCPITRIDDPQPVGSFTPNLTPTVTFRWSGEDPDGQLNYKPVRWVFRLFGTRNQERPDIPDYISYALLHPDSVRRFYAPEFRGWTSVGADTTSVQFRNLTVGGDYLFILNGFDEAGAYDPVLSVGRNMLRFSVGFSGAAGPVIRMFNQFFDYRYPSGGYDTSESRWFRIEVPAHKAVAFNWHAISPYGASIRRYRWAMDIADPDDVTPRSNEATDWRHWSAYSLNTTAATVGPFANNETHLFYIEAEDSNGLKSLGIIFFRVVRPTFERDLLFVDDARLRPDYRSSPGVLVDPPVGPWPTAAELDTFLFARGGVPWRGYPAGTLSVPGICTGYAFDTIGTRGISPDGIMPLSLLGQYKHVVWLVDASGATNALGPASSAPATSLRLMCSPGRPNTLATFVALGGRLWLAGGGAALASLRDWNNPTSTAYEYTSSELVPGRFMFDFAHWRSSIQMLPAIQARKFGSTPFGLGPRPGRGWPGQPDYSLLPATLSLRTSSTDSLPPLRSPTFFYLGTYDAEYLTAPNRILEDDDPDPSRVMEVSTLDTLYITRGGAAPPNSPVMTYYHGSANGRVVFSGFPVWCWQRSQCAQIVDFVLGSMWGIPKQAGGVGPAH